MSWRDHPLPHALLLATLLRLPLLLLPGPGRDEAAYHYWAWHPELFYAPLLQWMLRLSELLPVPAILALRLPSLLAGTLVLVLVDLQLRAAASPRALRWICLLALVVSEWQTYTGAILHPDQLMMASLLLVVLAARGGHVLLFALAMCSTALAKPTGLLFLPVGWVLAGRISATAGRYRIYTARLLMSASVVMLLSRAQQPMLEAMAQFGHMEESIPWALRVGGGLAAVFITGGPLLLLLAVGGVRERITLLRSAPGTVHHDSTGQRREAWTSLSLAAVLLAAFGIAALLRGQIKANWILPAAVLLLPLAHARIASWFALSSLGFGLLVSILMVQAHLSPERFATLESALARGSLRYELYAGAREAEVSPTRSWVERVSEYRDLRPFVDQIEEGWHELGATRGPRWIVSDDYGLASQIIWYRHNTGLGLVVPQDGIYAREIESLRKDSDPGPLLLLGVQTPVDELWPRVTRVSSIFHPPHPITGQPVQLAIGQRRSEETE